MVPREAMLGTAENHWWTLLPTLKIWSFTVKRREFEELDRVGLSSKSGLNLFSICICSGLFSVWSAVHLNPVLSKVDYDAQNRQYCSTVESSHTKFLEQSQYCSVVSIQRKFKKKIDTSAASARRGWRPKSHKCWIFVELIPFNVHSFFALALHLLFLMQTNAKKARPNQNNIA